MLTTEDRNAIETIEKWERILKVVLDNVTRDDGRKGHTNERIITELYARFIQITEWLDEKKQQILQGKLQFDQPVAH